VINLVTGALKGIKVLEIGDELTQFAGKLLADMGAEVIKIEPKEGAQSRKIGPFYQDNSDINNSLYFWHYNTSKKSITLDINSAEDREVFYKLVSEIDVILEDGNPSKTKQQKIDYETLCEINPRLIYCSVTPFGQNGPWKDYQSSDLIQLSLGGIMSVCGYDDVPEAPPIAPTGGQSAHIAGHFAVIGIMNALLFRDFGEGKGQYIDIAVHDCVAVSFEMSFSFWEYHREQVNRQTSRHALVNRSNPWSFPCKDGRHILALNTYLDTTRWKALVDWLASQGMEEDLRDERYLDETFRAPRMNHVSKILAVFFLQNDSEYLYHYAQSIKLPWAPVRAPEEMLNDKHLTKDRKAFVQVDHPELKASFIYPGAPYILNETPWQISSRAPLLEEHNDEISKWINKEYSPKR
jgi:benzylsuccinate CoA-transferase BbsE subunit